MAKRFHSTADVGTNNGTRKVGIDVTMTNKRNSLRYKIQVILSTYADLEKELGGVVEEPALCQALASKGEVTDEESRSLVEHLVREGILYYAKPGHLRRML